MKADGSLVSLIQGVSQQPARTRLPGQCEEQVDCSSNVVKGLSRRNPFHWIGTLASDTNILGWQEFIGTDGNHYYVARKANALRIFDYDFNEQTVSYGPGATAYLDGGELWFESIEGNTFVGNPRVEVQMDPVVKVYSRGGGYVQVLGGQYGRTYSLTIRFTDGGGTPQTVTVSTTTPDGDVASEILDIRTNIIAAALETALNADGTFTPTFNVTRSNDILYIRYDDPNRVDDFNIVTQDGDGGSTMVAHTYNVTNTAILARRAAHRALVKVIGAQGAAADDYYLQFLCNDEDVLALGTGFGRDGVWRECTAPDQPPRWDRGTMPHVLVTDGSSWTFAQGEWADREAGDDNTNPPPSFLGRTLNHASTFQGRLAFASGNSIIMSRTNKHLDFWNQSAVVSASDDPIDIMSTARSYAIMQKLVAHNRDMVVFSDQAQFIVFGRSAITPSNAALVLTTTFECDLRVGPVSAGRNVFFAIDNDEFVGLREFYTEGVEDINDSRPITQHVSQYIVGAVKLIANSTNFNTSVVLATGEPNVMHVYEYLWVDSEKVQSSWSKWTLPFEVEHVGFSAGQMQVIVKRPGGIRDLLRLNLEAANLDDLEYHPCLDYQVEVTANATTATLPYDPAAIGTLIAVQGAGCPNPGMRVQVSNVGTALTFGQDMGIGKVHIGIRYLSRYTPTMPMVKDANRVKVGAGKLKIRKFMISLLDTGFIRALIQSRYRAERSVEFSGRIVGDAQNLVGVPVLYEGMFNMPFRSDSDYAQLVLESDHHMPFTLLDIEWMGQYMKRGKRILGGAT